MDTIKHTLQKKNIFEEPEKVDNQEELKQPQVEKLGQGQDTPKELE
jgi:hypothetical protein